MDFAAPPGLQVAFDKFEVENWIVTGSESLGRGSTLAASAARGAFRASHGSLKLGRSSSQLAISTHRRQQGCIERCHKGAATTVEPSTRELALPLRGLRRRSELLLFARGPHCHVCQRSAPELTHSIAHPPSAVVGFTRGSDTQSAAQLASAPSRKSPCTAQTCPSIRPGHKHTPARHPPAHRTLRSRLR